MAELVDAPGSGPGGRKTVEGRVLFSAPILTAATLEEPIWRVGGAVVSTRVPSDCKRMAAHDRVVALRTGRDEIDRHFADFFDLAQIMPRRFGQRGEIAHAQRALRPSRHFLVDR